MSRTRDNTTLVTSAYDKLSRLISRSVGVSPTSASHFLYDEENCNTELRTYRSLVHGNEPSFATGGFDATTWAYLLNS